MATLTLDRIPAGRSVSSTRRQVPQTRLTRRGERVVAIAVTLLSVVAFSFISIVVSSVVQASQSPVAESVATTEITVASGDTLWDIAVAVDPSADPRATIDRIERLNAMTPGTVLQAGQSLLVPVIN